MNAEAGALAHRGLDDLALDATAPDRQVDVQQKRVPGYATEGEIDPKVNPALNVARVGAQGIDIAVSGAKNGYARVQRMQALFAGPI